VADARFNPLTSSGRVAAGFWLILPSSPCWGILPTLLLTFKRFAGSSSEVSCCPPTTCKMAPETRLLWSQNTRLSRPIYWGSCTTQALLRHDFELLLHSRLLTVLLTVEATLGGDAGRFAAVARGGSTRLPSALLSAARPGWRGESRDAPRIAVDFSTVNFRLACLASDDKSGASEGE